MLRMAQHLATAEVFEVHEIWNEMRNEQAAMGYETSTGVPYHHGVWKPLKGDYQFTTGTRANANEGAIEDGRRQKRTGLPQAPTYDMGEEMVKMLNAVTEALRQIDAD